MVVSGEKSEMLSTYAIDPSSGSLRPVGRFPTGKGSNWVEIVSFDLTRTKTPPGGGVRWRWFLDWNRLGLRARLVGFGGLRRGFRLRLLPLLL